MGDRGQIAVVQGEGAVYLYSHWGGSELAEVLRNALARKQRWDDEEYLTRIIFDTMTSGDQGAETGAGIGLQIHGDIEHALLVVDCQRQAVGVVSRRDWDERKANNYADSTAIKEPYKADRWIPFAEYITTTATDPDELLEQTTA
jgi:hypothetical protein